MLENSPIPELIDKAEAHLEELRTQLEGANSALYEQEKSANDLQDSINNITDELDTVREYIEALKGKQSIEDLVIEILRDQNNELSSNMIAKRTSKDTRTITKVLGELEQKGLATVIREEKAQGGHTRKYYKLTEEQQATTN